MNFFDKCILYALRISYISFGCVCLYDVYTIILNIGNRTITNAIADFLMMTILWLVYEINTI